jgi:hypothetical protein
LVFCIFIYCIPFRLVKLQNMHDMFIKASIPFRQGFHLLPLLLLFWSGFSVALQVLLLSHPGLVSFLHIILVASQKPCSAWRRCSYLYCAICFLLWQGMGSQGACARILFILSSWRLLRRVVIFEILNGG